MTSRALRDLVQVLRLEPDELRAELSESKAVARDLGLEAEDLRSILELEDDALRRHVERILRRRYVEVDQARRAMARNTALDAAQRIATTAKWHKTGAELELGVLLGPLTADRTMKFVGFDLGEHELCVLRSTLVAVRKHVRFRDVRASVDGEALQFRWRGGRGGLNFWHHAVRPHERDVLLRVVLHRPVIESALPEKPAERIGSESQASAAPRPERRRPGAWLGEILTDIGFSI